MKTEPSTPLLLFFASRQIGGGEAYFINLGLAAIRSGRRCIVVDYADGYVISKIPGAEHVEYSDDTGADYDGSCVAFIPLGAVVFLGSSLRLNPSSKVLFVSIHQAHAIEIGNWGWLLRGMRPGVAGLLWPILEPLRIRSVRRFFKEISRRCGLVYCAPFQRDFDQAYLRISIQSYVVCIPVSRRTSHPLDNNLRGESIIWVSRFAKEKAAMISELIAAMVTLRSKRKLILIGDGPEGRKIAGEAKAAGISCEMPGVIAGADLDCYVRCQAMVCVGVGTAAVEMAMAGVPTLVVGLPGQHRGKFAWLYETSPGDTLIVSSMDGRTLTLESAVSKLSDMDEWRRQADKCMTSAASRHDIETSWQQLSRALNATTLTVAEATEFGRMTEQPFAIIRRTKQALRTFLTRNLS